MKAVFAALLVVAAMIPGTTHATMMSEIFNYECKKVNHDKLRFRCQLTHEQGAPWPVFVTLEQLDEHDRYRRSKLVVSLFQWGVYKFGIEDRTTGNRRVCRKAEGYRYEATCGPWQPIPK